MKKYLDIFICFMFLFLSISCEDDALLDPKVDSGEDKGSYGNLSLPGDSDDDYSKIKDNPEIF